MTQAPVLPSDRPWKTPGFNLKEYVDSVEKRIVQDVIRECEGKKGEAAKLLGLTRFALRHQLKKHGLDEEG